MHGHDLGWRDIFCYSIIIKLFLTCIVCLETRILFLISCCISFYLIEAIFYLKERHNKCCMIFCRTSFMGKDTSPGRKGGKCTIPSKKNGGEAISFFYNCRTLLCVLQGFIYGEGYKSLEKGDNLYTQLGNMETFRVEERRPLPGQV